MIGPVDDRYLPPHYGHHGSSEAALDYEIRAYPKGYIERSISGPLPRLQASNLTQDEWMAAYGIDDRGLVVGPGFWKGILWASAFTALSAAAAIFIAGIWLVGS